MKSSKYSMSLLTVKRAIADRDVGGTGRALWTKVRQNPANEEGCRVTHRSRRLTTLSVHPVDGSCELALYAFEAEPVDVGRAVRGGHVPDLRREHERVGVPREARSEVPDGAHAGACLQISARVVLVRGVVWRSPEDALTK